MRVVILQFALVSVRQKQHYKPRTVQLNRLAQVDELVTVLERVTALALVA